MEVTYSHCAGLDVHKKTVVACCITPGEHGQISTVTQRFGTMSADLLALNDWLASLQVQQVAMESTGEYWKPVYNLLEANFALLVVNAHHLKQVPGRKTDVKDAQWIAQLLRHGLLRGSFIPPLPQRDLRDLTRQRSNLVQERAAVSNRLQKTLEWANVKLAAVARDVTGVSARAMLAAIVDGQTDAVVLADLAKGRLRSKRVELEQALSGQVREHHRFVIAQHLAHLDFLEEQIATFNHRIAQQLQAQPPIPVAASIPGALEETASKTSDPSSVPLATEAAVALLDTIPGVARATAELLLAEIGLDMSRFPSAAHLASWAKLCPGNHESAGKQYSGKTGTGNRWLRSGLIQAANAAIKCRQSYFAAVYRRLVQRRGHKRALVAVAHRILIAAYHILLRQQPFRDLGCNYLTQPPQKEVLCQRLQSRLERLGYQVLLQPLPSSS